MKIFFAVANKIYEIDQYRNTRIIYTGPENMTIQAVDYHYINQLLYFTDAYAHRVNSQSITIKKAKLLHFILRFIHYH